MQLIGKKKKKKKRRKKEKKKFYSNVYILFCFSKQIIRNFSNVDNYNMDLNQFFAELAKLKQLSIM